MPLHLSFETTAPGQDFHAALVVQRGGRGDSWTPHTHDFWEMMYVSRGVGSHLINGTAAPLKAGMLLMIRPHDCHAVKATAREALHFINIAFPAGLWQSFCGLTSLGAAFSQWSTSPSCPCVTLSLSQRSACDDLFQRTLRASVERPTRLDICRFWSVVIPFFSDLERVSYKKAPNWLSSALAAMQDEENLRLGLPQLVALAGVSPAHLSRTIKAFYGQTPTALINELRLKRAALLLRTSAEEIISVAFECGFNNLSYFYRCFIARYGKTPRAFRLDALGDIAPQNRTRAPAKEHEESSSSALLTSFCRGGRPSTTKGRTAATA
jgi:AraC-like DNA-binding protein/quercetin dioxygenase-like cupin family protein